ncbi:MAG: LysM peptidoglycan-binding domain-containing protein [Spirochaetales bacterium]|nr:LysM peptidoglycan-binding domain-containing protein [Spirochaetales bacterium]
MKWKYKLFTFFLFFLFVFHPLVQANEAFVIVRKGDTLYKIAQKFGIPVEALMKYNNIKDPKKVKEGTKICIPVIHKVKKGETLYSIAKKYNVTYEEILEFNSISEIKKIKVGQVLIIPVSDINDPVSGDPTPGYEEKTDLLWPLPGAREKLTGKLKGVAIKGKEKDTVVSVSSGKVIWAEAYRGFGQMVLVKSVGGYIYIYAGNQTLFVHVGEDIKVLTPIGLLGNNPHDGIPRVYFCVYRNGKPVDPYKAPRM